MTFIHFPKAYRLNFHPAKFNQKRVKKPEPFKG